MKLYAIYTGNEDLVFTKNCRKAPFFRCGDERQGFIFL